MRKEFVYRWIFFFIGIMILGLGIALTIKGQRFGVGSWDVLHIGLFKNFGLSIGTWSILVGIIVIIIASIGLREFPRTGTFMNMVFVGLFIDFFNLIIPNPTIFLLELICFILGIVFLAMGTGIYISADLGAGPRDSLMLLIVKKLKMSLRTTRTIMEVSVAIAGFLLGGPIGIGTVIMAFAVGPVMQTVFSYSKNMLDSLIADKQLSKYGTKDL